jgi:hypothetical protein
MKDGANAETPRGAVSRLWSGDIRMGKPIIRNGMILYAESIGVQRYTRGTETSKYPEEKKTTVIPRVVASETGTA